MTTATVALPSPAEIRQAAADSDFYADTLNRLGRNSREGAWFMAEVEAAYNAAKPTPQPLTALDARVLEFAGRTLRDPALRVPGRREQATRDEFGFSAVRYHLILNGLLDRPEALKAYPAIVSLLYRQRETRRAAREGRAAHTTPEGSAA